MNKRPMVGCNWVVGFAASALLASLSPAARADAAPAKPPAAAADLAAAKKHYADGEKKYKAGDFEGALVDFKAANGVKATPQAERFIGMCEDALGHYGVAVDWYDKFLAHVPDKMAAAADDLKKREAEIKGMPGKIHVDSTPPGASVAVDDKPASGSTPMDVELPPGPHKMTLSAPGRHPADKALDVTFASSQTVGVQLEAEASPAPPQAPAPAAVPPQLPPAPLPPRSLVPAYITGAIAIGAAGVGTVFGILALNDKSDFDKHPTTSKADDGDTHSLIADMAFGIGLTFGVTSAVLFLTKDEATPSPSASASAATGASKSLAPKRKTGAAGDLPVIVATPLLGPHLAGAGFMVRF